MVVNILTWSEEASLFYSHVHSMLVTAPEDSIGSATCTAWVVARYITVKDSLPGVLRDVLSYMTQPVKSDFACVSCIVFTTLNAYHDNMVHISYL